MHRVEDVGRKARNSRHNGPFSSRFHPTIENNLPHSKGVPADIFTNWSKFAGLAPQSGPCAYTLAALRRLPCATPATCSATAAPRPTPIGPAAPMSRCSSSSTTRKAARTTSSTATPRSEAFLVDVIGAAPWPGQRHANVESMYEYGARAGFWRLHRLFTGDDIPVTVYGVATALMRAPAAARRHAGGRLGDRRPRLQMDRAQGHAAPTRSAPRSPRPSASTPSPPASAPPAGTPAAPRSAPSTSSPRKAASSMSPTPMTTTCPIGARTTAAPSSSSPTRSPPTTCASSPRRASTMARSTSSS